MSYLRCVIFYSSSTFPTFLCRALLSQAPPPFPSLFFSVTLYLSLPSSFPVSGRPSFGSARLSCLVHVLSRRSKEKKLFSTPSVLFALLVSSFSSFIRLTLEVFSDALDVQLRRRVRDADPENLNAAVSRALVLDEYDEADRRSGLSNTQAQRSTRHGTATPVHVTSPLTVDAAPPVVHSSPFSLSSPPPPPPSPPLTPSLTGLRLC